MSASDSPSTLPAPSLLLAVTGGPGSSKTRLLAEPAAMQVARGHRVEAVLWLAAPRPKPGPS